MPKSKSQSGFSALLLLAILTVILFLLITNLAPFRNKVLSTLFPKQFSFAATTITVDANLNVHPISPYIYGTAANSDPYQKTMGASITRWGGNQVSRFNWEINDANAGQDWGLCNQGYLGRGAFSNVFYTQGAAGLSLKNSVSSGKTQNMDFLFTVPMIGWVAKDGNNNTCSTNVPGSNGPPLGSASNDEAAITGYDPTANRNTTSIRSQMKKGSAFVYPPSTTDGVVYQDELINYMVSQFGKANAGGIKIYAFDNEYDLWQDTHRDIHPAQTGYDALWNKYSTFSNAVKDVDSTALTTGPVSWGWIQYWTGPLGSTDRQNHGNIPFLKWFLRQAKTAETQTGRRILDVLDVHYYPQGGQYSTDVSTNMQALRLRSTRELWDPNYATESWQTCCEGGPNIQIINKLKQWISEEYPGTKIGFTEWNWGADNHINGALTIADVLGIFGREDVYLANYWTTPADQSPGYWAWRMFRNYDGNFSKFGDISINAAVPAADVDKASVYASKDSATGALKIMVINKQPSAAYDASFNLTNFNPGPTAKVYRYSQSDTSKINQLADASLSGTTLSAQVPAYSITLFVIPVSTGASPTPAQTTVTVNTNPTGLKVSVDGTQQTAPVTLQKTAGTSLALSAITPQQTTTGFTESSGQVVMEAENYTQQIPRSSHQWTAATGPLSNFTGAAYMDATPDDGMNNDLNVSLSPELQYEVNFTTAGTYYVWVRGRGINPESDSVNVGVDGVLSSTADRIGNLSPNLFEWLNNTTDGPRASIQIPSAGKHTINVWMREDGFKFDKLLLTTDSSTSFTFLPTGTGPAEIAKSSGATFNFSSWSDGGAATHNVTVPSSNITYTANFSQTAASPSPSVAPSPSPSLSPSPSPVPSGSGTQTIIFDDLGSNIHLNGVVGWVPINWGNFLWHTKNTDPVNGQFPTEHLSFNAPGMTNASFDFTSPKILLGLDINNRLTTGASTVTITCPPNPTKTYSVPTTTIITVTTGWATPCTTVNIATSNDWNTRFDNLVIANSVSSSPTPSSSPGKVGDISGITGSPDGVVDMWDYNQLLTDFTQNNKDPNAKGNLDGITNSQGITVDIFDYNLLLGNFGK